ncbi:hypothetical protein MUO14_03440 [Halobacillus shinanisalinarum]|uniref:Uncharacterized protein n=1 Tax=Halobacillus shinanisalinarum TaxID=2932258 RepID=A0ABY4H161_9BACI|nr:hypothetical protein [Halobacillus shinanisalinarum]UOQ94036.1 hypothetical protein MUO14_03440 [Halobacillus shinanisalinarum]
MGVLNLTRKFSIMLSKSKYSWSYLASYIENEEVQPSLTIYSKSSEGDHFIKPTTALTLRGEKSIRKLYDYLILLDEEHDFFNKGKFSNLTETFRPCTLTVKDPLTIIALKEGI